MSIDIPFGLIRKVQTQIRQQSPFSTYHPDDPSLPSLPSFQDVIAELDPSPSYLRCKRCKGSFLSGVNSLFCVYCGAQRHDPEVPPDPIKFSSTLAYRWLLDSLKLDGSEIVGKGQPENEPNRNLASPKKELTVSELLDLEIKWSERLKRAVDDVPVGDQLSPNKSSASLAGVDIENFLPSSKSVSASSFEKPGSSVANDSINRTAAQEDVDLFANAASIEVGVHHNSEYTSDDFSGWATQFQGSTPVNSQNEEISFDSFGVSSDLSASEKVEKSICDQKDPSPRNSDWNEEDLWSNFNSGIPEQSVKLKAPEYEVKDVSKELHFSSNQSDDWVLGDKLADSVNVADDDDSYNAWNDFAASSSAPQHQYNGSSEPLSSEVQSTETNLFGSNDLQDDIFGDFSQPALFSSSLANISTGTKQFQSESHVSNRVIDVSFKTEELNAEGENVDDVETLMSQMHDLSFMLESNLVIPRAKADS